MSEFRQDRTTGAWVIIAPERRQRPRMRAMTGMEKSTISNCPFCPGNEELLAGIIDEIELDAPPGWRTRVVPNLYPVVGTYKTNRRRHGGTHRSMDGCGRHEVIIETPRHHASMANFTDAEIDGAMTMYHRRYVALSKLSGVEAVVLFRNEGWQAGASLEHPHAQIIGLVLTPPGWKSAANWARALYRDHGYCVTCDELAAERKGIRAVDESDSFVGLVPYAATSPCELWLLPKRHEASFGAARPEEMFELGRLLRRSLRRIAAVLGAIPFQLVIDTAARRMAGAPHLHWKLRIVPDMVIPGGFELGTGLPVNPCLPEADAEALRSIPEERF